MSDRQDTRPLPASGPPPTPAQEHQAATWPSQPAGRIAPDEVESDDEGNVSQSNHSSLTSITSSIMYGVVAEGKRTYAVYGKEEYGFPMDDREMDRMDLCHSMYYALLDKQRFSAPIDPNPQRILDLGCGTGIWAVDMADDFPSAEVVGVDIAPVQPDWVPPNCSFELDDIEQPWTWKEGTADFIFGRNLFLSVRDFPKLIDQCYRHLKPGGWLELQCITAIVHCDDGTVPANSAYQRMSDLVGQACERFGTPVDDPVRWKDWLTRRGFRGVTEVVHKLPCSPWALDKRLKLVGMWEQHHLLNNVDGMVMRLFHKGLGWTEQEILVFCALFRKDLKNLDLHAWFPYIVREDHIPNEPVAGDERVLLLYPDVAHAAVHLALLECLYKLRLSANDLRVGTEHPPSYAETSTARPCSQALATPEDQSWHLLIRLAVERCSKWWSEIRSVLHHAPTYFHYARPGAAVQLSREYLPPLDVLLVWYALTLDSDAYGAICHARQDQVPGLQRICFPWPAIRDAIDLDTMRFTLQGLLERARTGNLRSRQMGGAHSRRRADCRTELS
ncbi:hypothetical protein HIM_01946 [Hirsutella minnesotensis 3608]|nr:hypothetical protein HIM_01946 [Hirsutella minnesotensis 3608]